MEYNRIIPFDISRLRVAEQIEFFGMTVEIVKKHNNGSNATIGEAIDALTEAHKDADGKFKQTRNSDITGQMVAVDELRDKNIICLRMWADAMTRHYDTSIIDAAELVLETIDNYGMAIYNMNYEEETATIRNLINDFKTKQQLTEAIKILSMNKLVTVMEKNNNKFRKLYMTRLEERTYNNELSAGEAVKLAINNYRVLVRTLESMAFLQPTDALNNIIAEINTLAERQIEKLNERESRGSKDDNMQTPEPELEN